jgi:hypothetical protein
VKKLIALLFVVALLCSTTVGCGDKKPTGGTGGTGAAPAASKAETKAS